MKDGRLVQKLLVLLFKVRIASHENVKDLSKIKLPKLLSVLYAYNERRMIRNDKVITSVF